MIATPVLKVRTALPDAAIDVTLLLQILHSEPHDVSAVDLVAEETVTVPPKKTVDYLFQPQTLKHPKLWWPLGMGEQVPGQINSERPPFPYKVYRKCI